MFRQREVPLEHRVHGPWLYPEVGAKFWGAAIPEKEGAGGVPSKYTASRKCYQRRNRRRYKKDNHNA